MTQPNTNANVVLSADVQPYQQSMGQANQSTNNLLNTVDKLSQSIDNVFKKAGRKLELFGAAEMGGVGVAVRSLAQLDQQMSQLRATAALAGGSTGLGQLKTGLREMGSQIPMAQRDLVGLATTIQGLGVQGTQQILALTKTFAQLQAITGESGAGLASSLVQLTRSMGNSLNPDQVKGYAAAVADLSTKLGTSASGITQFAQSIQPLGKVFGLTEKQILGMAGAFSKAGADSQAAANAFGQVITMITNDMQTGSPQIKQFADILGMSTDSFTKLVKNNPSEALAELFDSIQRGGKQSLVVLQSLGLDGIRTMNALQRVSQGGGIRTALGISDNAKAGDLTKGSTAAFHDLNDEITKLGHSIQTLMTGPFETFSKGITLMVGYIDKLVSGIAKFANMPGMNIMLQAFGLVAGFAGPLLALTGIIVGLVPVLAKLGFAWGAIFSRSGLSVMGGMRDRLSGMEQSAAAAAIQRGMPGAGPLQTAYYGAGQRMGSGLARLGFGPGGEGPGMVSRVGALGIRGGTALTTSMLRTPLDTAGAAAWGYAGGGMRGALMSRYQASPFGRSIGDQFGVARQQFGNLTARLTGRPITTAPVAGGGDVVASARAAEAKAIALAEKETLAYARAAQGASNQDMLKAKAAATAATADREKAEQSLRTSASINSMSEEAIVAAKSLAGLVLASGKASLGVAAAGAGSLMRGAGSMLSSAVGGPMGAAFIGYAGYSYLAGRNKTMSSDELDNSKGTLVGNLNALNQATGGTTTTMEALATAAKNAADKLNPPSPNGPAAAWSDAEVTEVTASGYKAAYKQKGKITAAQQQSQVLGMGSALSGTGTASDETIDKLRKDLLASYGGDVSKAKPMWDRLVKATDNFTHSSTDFKLNQRVFLDAAAEIKTADSSRLNPFGKQTDAQQKSRANLQGLALSLGISATGGGASQNTLNLLAGLPAGSNVASAYQTPAPAKTKPGAPLPVQPWEHGSLQEKEAAGVGPSSLNPHATTVGKSNVYVEAAKAMGFPASVGNVNNLRDMVINILSSSDKGVHSQAKRLGLSGLSLNAVSGMSSDSQVQQYLTQQGLAAQVKANTQAALKAAADSEYNQSGVEKLGIGQGASSKNISAVLGMSTEGMSANPAAVAKAAEDMAEAVTKGGASAAQATGSLSQYAATTRDTTGAVQALTDAAQALVSQFNQMQRATMAPAQALESINAEIASLDPKDKSFGSKSADLKSQQTAAENAVVGQAQQYLLAQHSLNIQLARGAEDYQVQVERSTAQFDLQRERSQESYNRQTLRNQKSFNLSMQRAEQDYQTQVKYAQADYNKAKSRQNRDWLYQEAQYVKQVAQALDPWSQVQAENVADAQQVLANMQDQAAQFGQAGQKLDSLRQMGLNQDVVDVLGLSDPKNVQKLNRFYTDIAQNPQLIQSFNTSIKGRLDWTKGLATNKSSTQWRDTVHQFQQGTNDMAEDFAESTTKMETAHRLSMQRAHVDYKTAVDNNAKDFKIATAQSEADFQLQMDNMAADYNKSIHRALADINDFATEAYGQASDIMLKALNKSKGHMHTFFSEAAGEFRGVAAAISGANPSGGSGAGKSAAPGTTAQNPITTPGTVGITAKGNIGSYDSKGHFTPLAGGQTAISQIPGAQTTHIASPTSVTAPVGANTAQRYAASKFGSYNWSNADMQALITLWNGESGWRSNARNPGGAFGIAQALGHGNATSAVWNNNTDQGRKLVNEYPIKSANAGNYQSQIDWGLQYIKSSYGNPSHALSTWLSRSPHWYAAGGVFNGPRHIGVGERGPEMVLPLNNQGVDFLLSTARQLNNDAFTTRNSSKYASQVAPTMSSTTTVDSSTNFTGPVTVQAQDPNAMAAALKAKARMQALTRPELATGAH